MEMCLPRGLELCDSDGFICKHEGFSVFNYKVWHGTRRLRFV